MVGHLIILLFCCFQPNPISPPVWYNAWWCTVDRVICIEFHKNLTPAIMLTPTPASATTSKFRKFTLDALVRCEMEHKTQATRHHRHTHAPRSHTLTHRHVREPEKCSQYWARILNYTLWWDAYPHCRRDSTVWRRLIPWCRFCIVSQVVVKYCIRGRQRRRRRRRFVVFDVPRIKGRVGVCVCTLFQAKHLTCCEY